MSIYNLLAKVVFDTSQTWIGNKLSKYLQRKYPALFDTDGMEEGVTQIDMTYHCTEFILVLEY